MCLIAAGHLAASPKRGVMEPTIKLTTRETDVLQLLAAGHTYTQVGEQLGVSANTVASHVKSIYKKLEVHSGRAAVWRALELRLLGEADVVPSTALLFQAGRA